MSAPVFLAPSADLARAVIGQVMTVAGDEAHHAIASLRLRPGEQLDLVDGVGRRVLGTVDSVQGKDRLTVAVRGIVDQPAPSPRILVAQALPKGERADLAVELLTEVGVDAIIPWQARNCVSRWDDPAKQARGVERWRATARTAAKQARRSWIPEIAAPVSSSALAATLGSYRALVLHELAPAQPWWDAEPLGELPVLLIVGPEGGISPDELAVLTGSGAELIRVGPSVLRTSTAGAVAAAVLLSRSRRWAGL